MQQTRKTSRLTAAVAMTILWLAGSGWAADAPATTPTNQPAAAADEIVVLDGNSPWRHFIVSRCAFARTPEGKLEAWDLTPFGGSPWPGMRPKPATATDSSPLPPADWAGVAIEDSAWPRVRLPQPPWLSLACRPSTKWGATATLCLRARFEVKDPTQVKACWLELDYLGGVVVYLNGKEVVRRHLSNDKPDLPALAEDYPKEAFITPKGDFVGTFSDRQLRDFAIPGTLLRRGINVLAIEVHTAPLPLAYVKETLKNGAFWESWMPIGLLRARLAVSPGVAVVPNVARPAGIQVWNSAPYETLSVFDFGDPWAPLRQVVIHGARNTAFSGRLVVSSDQPLKGLTVKASDLVAAGGG